MEEKLRTLGSINARHFSASLDEVRLRTGNITERIKINHPEAAAVVAFFESKRILMVRQWRYAIGRETLEIPAGKVDPGEQADECARRELQEETGFAAKNLFPLFRYYPAIGYSNEVIEIFAASSLKKVSGKLDVDEIARVELVELDRAYKLIADGVIQDGKTVIGICLFRARMEQKEIPADFFRSRS